MNEANEKFFLEIRDVARALGKSTRTVQRWVKAGSFPPGRMHMGRRKWTQREIQRWLRHV